MKITLLLVLLSVHGCSSAVGRVGQSVTLSCKYNIKKNGECAVCWGRGDLPSSGCSNPLIYTDGVKVTTRTSGRYQLLGRLDRGDVSLTILNLSESDAGRYGCRVAVPGLFNDIKHHVDLTIEDTPQVTTESTPHGETTATTAGPRLHFTTGQLTSTPSVSTSSSDSVKAERQQDSDLMVALALVLFGLIAVGTVLAIVLIMRRWRSLKKMPQRQQEDEYVNTVQFNMTSSTLQLHRASSAVENIYQIDGGVYESCP